MEKKRDVSVLIPYYIKDGVVFVFLQKRDQHGKVLPGHFSFFGGKIELGETPSQALEREIKEELGITVAGYQFLGQYLSQTGFVLNVSFLEVAEDFQKHINIMEGEYGKFFSEEEMAREPMLLESDKKIIGDLYKKLQNT